MGVDQDILACTMLDKDTQHTVHRTAFLAACIELAIAVGSCPTLAVAIVALGVDNAFALDA